MPGSPEILPLKSIRLLALNSQGLPDAHFGKGKKGALSVIQHLGYVQIDTLAVVARAHHHTLYSRLPDYKESFLGELMEKDKSVFEYWSHAASYLPMSDYRYSLPRKKLFAEGKSHWFAQDKKIMKYVLDRIRAEGALQSKDFEFKRTGPGNWYEWKPAKKALEQLFMDGTLMVARRQGFQKVYDLAERVLPPDVNTEMPTAAEYAEYLVKKAVEANGVVEEKEIAYLRKGLKESVNKALKKLIKSGEYKEVRAEGYGDSPFITSLEQLDAMEKLKLKKDIHLLSPFDNLVIQRKRLQRFFGFDYQVECYVPEPKRKFGYFCLPVLYGDAFAGRFDPKADRATKTFYVKVMHFEKGFKPDDKFNTVFAEKLKAFATFNGCTKIKIGEAEKGWKKEITKKLKD
ncbi:MAG: uncharacterized protein JWO44_616 [Bacteroidetes bacterium]|nr:uncharacterized protein [Bacteroidota bacterium]